MTEGEPTQEFDLVIIGGGPAGLTAAIYAGRARIKSTVIESGMPGGQAATSYNIENYPGFPGGIQGPDLAQKMEEHAREFGAEMIMAEVSAVTPYEKGFLVRTSDGLLGAPALIIASGARPRRLGVPGEDEFRGRGVSFCATCDGAFFKDKDIVVVGGGDSAVEEAYYLTRFASHLYIVHRRDQLRAAKGLQEKVLAHPKIEMVWDSVVTAFEGKHLLEGVKVSNVKTSKSRFIPASGAFLYVGLEPNTEFLRGVVEMDDLGHIITNEVMETSLPGVFAAGDVRSKVLRQVSTAVGDGAVAAAQAVRYLSERV